MDERLQLNFFFPRPFSFWFPSHELIASGAAYQIIKRSQGPETIEIDGNQIEVYAFRETPIVSLSRGVISKKKVSKYGLWLPN